MSVTLSIIGAFVFGVLLGAGAVGGILGWMLADNDRVALMVATWLMQHPEGDALVDEHYDRLKAAQDAR